MAEAHRGRFFHDLVPLRARTEREDGKWGGALGNATTWWAQSILGIVVRNVESPCWPWRIMENVVSSEAQGGSKLRFFLSDSFRLEFLPSSWQDSWGLFSRTILLNLVKLFHHMRSSLWTKILPPPFFCYYVLEACDLHYYSARAERCVLWSYLRGQSINASKQPICSTKDVREKCVEC